MRRVGAWMAGAEGVESHVARRMFWVALTVRVLYMTLAHTYRVRVLLDHFQFGWEMGRIARALATGYGYADPFNGHSGPTAWTPPLYPVLLAGVFKVFGVYTARSAWMILAINSVFSAGIAPAVYEMAWRCFGRDTKGLKVALWSGWLWALYPAAIQFAVHWIWEMSVTAFLFAWVLVLALRVRGIGTPGSAQVQTARRWIGFGLLWGAIALSNSSLLLFMPGCALWMVWGPRGLGNGIGRRLRNVTLSAIFFVAVVSPWVVRNWYAFHAFVPMRANLGAEIYESVRPSNHGFPWGAALPLAETAPDYLRYKRLGEVRYSKEQGERAGRIIAAHRTLFYAHAVKRIYFFWVSVPHPIEKSVTVEVVREINYAFLSLGGLLGLLLALRRRVPGAWLFFWAFAMVPLPYYFLTVQARFRHPLEPVITVLIVYLFQSAELPRTERRSMAEVQA